MESHIEKSTTEKYRKIFCLGELALVFLPVLLFMKIMGSWVGEDTIRNLTVVWIANIFMLVMVWTSMRLRGDTLKDFGLTFKRIRLREAPKIFGLSLLVFVIASIAYLLGPIILAYLGNVQQTADYSRLDFLKDNLLGLLLSLAGVYLISSFGEEVIYRAFLINRISELLQSSKYSSVIAVLISSVFFGLIHYEWGMMGMIQTGCMGLVMGISYIRLKKRLWVLVLAHGYMDTLLLVQLYIASN